MTDHRIDLTDREVHTLVWAAEHGYWPEDTARHMHLANGEPQWELGWEDDVARQWVIPDATSIVEMADDDADNFMGCIGGDLARKCLDLLHEIE